MLAGGRQGSACCTTAGAALGQAAGVSGPALHLAHRPWPHPPGNTGAVLVIAPSLDFEFVCFPPSHPPPGEAVAEVVEDAVPAVPPVAVRRGGVGLYNSPPPRSPFAAQAEAAAAAGAAAWAVAAAPEAVPGAPPSPAAQAMQQVHGGQAWCLGFGLGLLCAQSAAGSPARRLLLAGPPAGPLAGPPLHRRHAARHAASTWPRCATSAVTSLPAGGGGGAGGDPAGVWRRGAGQAGARALQRPAGAGADDGRQPGAGGSAGARGVQLAAGSGRRGAAAAVPVSAQRDA